MRLHETMRRLYRGYTEGINKEPVDSKLIMDRACKICGKKFSFQSSLSRHGRSHKQVRVQCPCGIWFSRKDNLKRHQFTSQKCKALEESTKSIESSQNVSETFELHHNSKSHKVLDDFSFADEAEASTESDSDDEYLVKRTRSEEPIKLGKPDNLLEKSGGDESDSDGEDDEVDNRKYLKYHLARKKHRRVMKRPRHIIMKKRRRIIMKKPQAIVIPQYIAPQQTELIHRLQ